MLSKFEVLPTQFLQDCAAPVAKGHCLPLSSSMYSDTIHIALLSRPIWSCCFVTMNFNLNSVGETVNLMAIDSQRMMDVTSSINTVWTSPMAIILSFYFLWGYLGPSALAGLVVMVLLIPVNAILSNKMKKYQKSNMKNKDTRIKVLTYLLSTYQSHR